METKKENPFYIYGKLFQITFVLSACTFGGGFVIISMLQKKFVEELHWLTQEEMMDMTAIAQAAPGALAVNAAIIIGYRLKKRKGALVCTLGTILPPLVILSLISLFYRQFSSNPYISAALTVMRAGVAAVIFDVILKLGAAILKTKNLLWAAMMVLAFLAAFFLGVKAPWIILACGAVGLLYTGFARRKEKGS